LESLRSHVVQSIGEIQADEWGRLVPEQHPFLGHAFLSLLEEHGGINGHNGWQPMHLTLWRDEMLIGAVPLYLKSHSWGEFVFDWAWAQAFERSGQRYYPKLLSAVPLSPVEGPRLLTGGDADVAIKLAQLIQAMTRSNQLSSAHVNFIDADGSAVLKDAGFLERRDWQYHWQSQGENSFADFLATLKHKKRKNIRQERQRVRADGWRFRRIPGIDALPRDWDTMAALYRHTFERKGNWALLSPAFFHALGENFAEQVVLVLGERCDQTRAAALMVRSATALHGRYWGTTDPTPGLHFETCYYQGIEYCLDEGIERFDPGAQGSHKIPRGFVPRETRSFHYIAEPRFREAISRFLEAERLDHDQRGLLLADHSPFRQS
jgi:predicted N-acyltransferase